jgi:hypothetical protein
MFGKDKGTVKGMNPSRRGKPLESPDTKVWQVIHTFDKDKPVSLAEADYAFKLIVKCPSAVAIYLLRKLVWKLEQEKDLKWLSLDSWKAAANEFGEQINRIA